jgi:tetratricopeptide (TPR) repeat protein
MTGERIATDGGRPGRLPDVLIFILIATCVWSSWQIIRHAYAQIAPPLQAIRLNPDSPSALSKAAAQALAQGRPDQARRLATRSLAIQPFNVRALRVMGLVAEREGSPEQADRMITLAGNWSLRDGPAHSWLVRRRIAQQQIPSAMAHADTLLRRQPDLHGAFFEVLTRGALSGDRAAQGALIELVRREPPWRTAYLNALIRDPQTLGLAIALAASLRQGEGRFTEDETAQVYAAVAAINQPDILRRLRQEIEGAEAPILTNGGFEQLVTPSPFSWRLRSGPGVLVEIADHPERGDPALHAYVNDLNQRMLAEQLLLLRPGRWRLSARFQVADGTLAERLAWSVFCQRDERRPLVTLPVSAPAKNIWEKRSIDFTVPPEGCGSQWLRLVAPAQDRREGTEVWLDDVELRPLR